MSTLSIEQHWSDSPEFTQTNQMLSQGLSFEAHQKKQLPPIQEFSLRIVDTSTSSIENLLGGLTGLIYFGCLYIDKLWLVPNYRHRGWGAKLIIEACKLAQSKGCSFATVCTMDWEAQPFYEKLGFEVEFTRDGYDKDSKMIFLTRRFHEQDKIC